MTAPTAPSLSPVLVCSRRLPATIEQALGQRFRVVENTDDHPLSPAELVTRCRRGVDGTPARVLVVTPTDRLDAATLDALPPDLGLIATFSVGHEHIDVAAATRRGILVTNTPGVLTDATADLALLLILGAARRASEGEREIRSGSWSGWRPTHLMGTHLGGKRLGILGMGRIGQAVATRARAFGMVIHYHNRHRLPATDEMGAVYHPTADSLLAASDILSLHCPATPETVGFLSRDRIALLPQGAIVINTARGVVVDDDALIDALRTRRLAAAGLDVFTGEPNLHPGYRALDNTFLLPHLGSATLETRTAMGQSVLDSLDSFLAGQRPKNSL